MASTSSHSGFFMSWLKRCTRSFSSSTAQYSVGTTNTLTRRGFTADSLSIGERVRAAGAASRRGEPAIFLGTADAGAREIRDGDHVRVFNDVGSFEVQAKVTANLRPGQVIVYHAWEPFQFRRGKSHQSLIPSPMNPIHLAGGYFQLQPTLLMGEPGCPDRGTRVEVERLARS